MVAVQIILDTQQLQVSIHCGKMFETSTQSWQIISAEWDISDGISFFCLHWDVLLLLFWYKHLRAKSQAYRRVFDTWSGGFLLGFIIIMIILIKSYQCIFFSLYLTSCDMLNLFNIEFQIETAILFFQFLASRRYYRVVMLSRPPHTQTEQLCSRLVAPEHLSAAGKCVEQIIQICQWSTSLVTDHELSAGRKVIPLCCSVSWVIEAFTYMEFVWGKPQRGSTWWRRWGVVKKTGWSVGESDLWPTTWMDSLSSSPEDKQATAKRFLWQYTKAELAHIPVSMPSVPEAQRIRQVGLSGEKLSHQEGCCM